MFYLILILGVVVWAAAHLYKRETRDFHAGVVGKSVRGVAILVGLVLMIIGYREAAVVDLWYPPAWTVHVTNLLMLGAVFIFGLSATKGRLRSAMRHPQLNSVTIWSVAHLLVNGSLAALILFGGLLGWAVVQVIAINRSETWVRPEPGPAIKDYLLVVITLVLYFAIAYAHVWLGVWPFPGGLA